MYELTGQTYLSTVETARRLGLRPATLRNYRSEGRQHVPWLKLGHSVVYRDSDVAAYIERHRLSA